MEVTIRNMRTSDYEAVATILTEAGMSGTWLSRELLEKGLSRNEGFYLVAETDGVVVGTIFASHDGWYYSYIYKLGVLQSHRRQGIGRKLVEEVTARLKAVGIDWFIGGIKPENEASLKLFEELGFQVGPYQFVHKWLEQGR